MLRIGKSLRAWAALLSCGFFLVFCPPARANNVKIENVTLEDRVDNTGFTLNLIVEFDISWDNSWRDEINYDGVWLVFYLENTSTSSFTSKRLAGPVSTSSSSTPKGNSVYEYRHFDPGTNTDLEMEIPSDAALSGTSRPIGLFLYRKSTGSGTMQSKNVRVPIHNIASSIWTTSIKMHIFAIEMVYIPEAPFYAGDTAANSDFQQGSSDTDPWYIDSENSIRTSGGASNTFYYTNSGATDEFATGAVFTIMDWFPKGYQPFWMMKYEITEQQYADFFNTLTANQQTARDISSNLRGGKNSSGVVKRNWWTTDAGSPATASSQRPDRALTYMDWPDLSAYCDWAGLRPMTELEFEKAARGPLSAVAGEYAWGGITIGQGGTFSISPELGNETFTDDGARAVYESMTYSQGDTYLGTAHEQGPVRVGIFASSTTTRANAGAGYYGNMELSGNVSERAVGVGNTTVVAYWPSNGDGVLSTASGSLGNAMQLGWIGLNTTGNKGVDATPDGVGQKGGHWDSSPVARLEISDRNRAMNNQINRTNYTGGRCVRGYNPPDPLLNCDDDNTIHHPEQCDDTTDENCQNCMCVDNCCGPGGCFVN